MDSFGRRLKGLRDEKGLTQAEVAKEVGVSRVAYLSWENGSKSGKLPSGDRLNKVAAFFGVRPEWLYDGTPPRLQSQPPPSLTPDQKEILEILEPLKPEDRAMILAMAKRMKKGE